MARLESSSANGTAMDLTLLAIFAVGVVLAWLLIWLQSKIPPRRRAFEDIYEESVRKKGRPFQE